MEKTNEEDIKLIPCEQCVFQNNCHIKTKLESERSWSSGIWTMGCEKGLILEAIKKMLAEKKDKEL